MLIDVNGDGLDDWLYSMAPSTYVLLNNGTGWDATSSSRSGRSATSTLYQVARCRHELYYDRGIRFFDINGDGLPDFIRSYQMSYATKNAGVRERSRMAPTTPSFSTPAMAGRPVTAYTLPSIIVTGHVTGGNWDGSFTVQRIRQLDRQRPDSRKTS